MFDKLLKFIRSKGQETPLLSPLPERESMVSPDYEPPANRPTPTPTPTPPKQYRNPNWETWAKTNPKGFQELLSATQTASKETGVPPDLLMDISGIETSGGQFLKQLSGGPGRGYYQFEGETLNDIGANIDPMSATESAGLAANLISKKQLSRWGTPKSNWGSLNNPRNANGRLSDWYSPEELNQYLTPQHRF